MSGNGTLVRWWMILLLLVADQKVRSPLACRGVDSGMEETEEMQGNFIISLFYFHWWVVLNSTVAVATTDSIFPSVGV